MTPEQRDKELIKVIGQSNQISSLYYKAKDWGDEEFKLKLDKIFESFGGSFEEKMESALKALSEAEERWKPKREARKQAALEAVAKLNGKA